MNQRVATTTTRSPVARRNDGKRALRRIGFGSRSVRSLEHRTAPRTGDIEETTRRTCPGPTPDVCDGSPRPNGIVLVEDEWIELSRLREIFEQTSDLIVVAACRCADGAMLAVERYRPA